MNTLLKSFVAALAALLMTASAHAVDFVGATFSGGGAENSVVAYGTGDSQSFDINLGSLHDVTLDFIVQGGELASTLSFNALINNFSGFNIDGLAVTLTGGAIFVSPYGTVTPTFGTIGATHVAPTLVSTYLSSGEGYALHFGNPLAESGLSDWTIDFSGVASGQTFGVTVAAVPEPETYAMMLAGLAFLAALARRRN